MSPISRLFTFGTALLSTLTATTTTASVLPSEHQKYAVNSITRRQGNASNPLCTYSDLGKILLPTPNTTITQTEGDYDGVTFTVLYCSGEYFKTSSLSATVGLAYPDSYASGGLVLGTPGMGPSGGYVAEAGFYGYYFNVTVYPISGSYITGTWRLSVFELATGYYNAYNYIVNYVDLNFVVNSASK